MKRTCFRLLSFFLACIILSACSQKSETVAFAETKKASHFLQKGKKIALIISPVVDVLGNAPDAFKSKVENSRRYRNIPFSHTAIDYKKVKWSSRLHQLLFNQLVYVVKEHANEALVEIPELTLKPNPTELAYNLKGWISKKHLIFLDQMQRRGFDFETLPAFKGSHFKSFFLLKPHFVKELGIKYSVATEFVIQNESKEHWIVPVFQANKMENTLIYFPKNKCLVNKEMGFEEKINRFLSILHIWAQSKEGFIPYVLGGSSCTDLINNKKVIVEIVKTLHKKGVMYKRPWNWKRPASGLDCSSMIYLAARMAGLPYNFKNTSSLKNQLKEIQANEPIEPGDLLWIPGHVMVLSRVDKSLSFIHAAGYSLNYGRVCEIQSKDLFRSVHKASDLISLKRRRQALQLLNAKGEVAKIVNTWKILKIRSCKTLSPSLQKDLKLEIAV